MSYAHPAPPDSCSSLTVSYVPLTMRSSCTIDAELIPAIARPRSRRPGADPTSRLLRVRTSATRRVSLSPLASDLHPVRPASVAGRVHARRHDPPLSLRATPVVPPHHLLPPEEHSALYTGVPYWHPTVHPPTPIATSRPSSAATYRCVPR